MSGDGTSGAGAPSDARRSEEGPDDQQGVPEPQPFVEMDPSDRFGRYDKVLGRGAFKTVYKAFDNQEGMEVAWNQVRVSELMPTKDGDGRDERERLMAEIKMLKSLKHKNIMTFYTYWWDPKTYTVNFITELFTSGTLRQYRKRHRKGLDPEVQKRWAWQILCGLVYLHGHSPPIIHRDLKCDNIFINGSDGTVKIGDLGLATLLRSQTAPQSVLGTPEFMAPELYEETYDAKVDVYSFGMCLLELDIMEYPYAECKNAAQIYRKVSLGIRPKGLQEVQSKQLQELINLCIAPYNERPASRQLLKHPYFDSIRPARVVASASTAALAAAQGGSMDVLSEYGGSVASGGVSRTVSGMAEAGAVHVLPASASRDSMPGAPGGGPAPVSRSVSGVPTEQHSDAGSIHSQRSNASELAATTMINGTSGAEAGMGGAGEQATAAALRPSSPFGSSRPGSAPGSKPPSPPTLSPRGSPKATSPTGSEGTRCEATNRRFVVVGKYLAERDKFNLRLRICEPGGDSRTVEFEFDLSHDTAVSVAGEMVEELQLSPEDAAAIASAIKAELEGLASQLQGGVSMQLEIAAAALQQGLRENAASQAGEGEPGAPGLQQAPGTALLAARARGSAASVTSNASVGSGGSHASASAALPPQAGEVPSPPQRVLSPPPLPRSGLGPHGSMSLPPLPTASAQPDLPSPSQRVMRSNSIDALLLRGEPFSRSSSAVHARDMALQSPHRVGSSGTSGTLTPSGGILSPAPSYDKRTKLQDVVQNLTDFKAANGEGNEGSGAPAGAPSLAPLSASANTSALAGAPTSAAALGHARSEACLPSVPIIGAATGGSSNASPRSHGSFPTGSSNLADVVAPLDVQLPPQQAQPQHLPVPGLPSLAKVGSGGRLSSRDASPGREASGACSPVRAAATATQPAANGVGAAAGAVAAGGAAGVPDAGGCAANGKKPPAKDKEALRKQAADAMKAVELRSLNLLEGGLLAGKAARGTPMAASRKELGACGCPPAGASGAAAQGAASSLAHSGSGGSLTNVAGLGAAAATHAAPGAAPGVTQPPRPTTTAPQAPGTTLAAPPQMAAVPAAAAAAAAAVAPAAQASPMVVAPPMVAAPMVQELLPPPVPQGTAPAGQ